MPNLVPSGDPGHGDQDRLFQRGEWARLGRRRFEAQAAGTDALHAPAHPPCPPLEDGVDERILEELLEPLRSAQRLPWSTALGGVLVRRAERLGVSQ